MTNDPFDPDDGSASQSDDKERQVNPGAGKKPWQGGWKTSKPSGKPGNKQDSQAEAMGNVIAPVANPGALRLPGGAARQLELLLANREHQLRRFLFRFGLFVLLPCFIVWFYTMFIATPRYQCIYQITYTTYQPGTSLSQGLTQTSFGSTATDSIDYGTLLYQYVRSPALAEQVDKLLDLRAHYSTHNIDWLSRLSPNATQQQFLAYWQSRVQISEGFGGYLTLTVEGFDPQFTLKLAQTINTLADQMIDQLGAPARNTEVDSAKQQLATAATGLQSADQALTQFRNTHGDLDPSFMATEIGTIEATLDGQLATLKAQLGQDNANMLPSSPTIVQLKLQIAALEAQIQAERTELANNNGQPNYSDTVAKYQDALANQLLATSTFQAAQQGLVLAQADAAQQQNYVVPFAAPVLPDRPTAPNPVNDTLITFLACVGLYGIGNLLFSAFRDQAGI